MFIESIYGYGAIDRDKLQDFVFKAVELEIDRICAPTSILTDVRQFYDNIDLVALIDYPYGLSSSKCKEVETVEAIRHGIKHVDICLNKYLIKSLNYDKALSDIMPAIKACQEHKVNIRLVMEQRLLSQAEFIDAALFFYDIGLNNIVTATGYMIDFPLDNILLCKRLVDKKIFPTLCGAVYTQEYFDILKRVGVYALRFNSIYQAENLLSK